MTSSKAYEWLSAAQEKVSRLTETKHPPYSIVLTAIGGVLSVILLEANDYHNTIFVPLFVIEVHSAHPET
jgi:hypothetical protein